MTNQDLYRAIGEAEDSYLLECEQSAGRRVPRRFGIIAAVVALMLTACAAPVIVQTYDKIRTGEQTITEPDYVIYVYENGSKKPTYIYYRSTDAEVEVSVNEDAPEKIETLYIPEKLLEYAVPEFYEQTDTAFTLTLSAPIPSLGRIACVQYRQYALNEDGGVKVPEILGIMKCEKTTKTYGKVTVLEFFYRGPYERTAEGEMVMSVEVLPVLTEKVLFWSDGDYLYCLKFPQVNRFTTSAVEEVVNSLTPVDDLSQYLTAE